MHEHTPLTTNTPRLRDPQHWVQLITEAFAHGTFEGVRPLSQFLHADFVGKAAQTPDALGPDGWLSFFARLYALVPDLKGEILRSAPTVSGDGVYVELRLSGTLRGRKLSIDVCDYFSLRDGLIAARVTYFDPLPLLMAAASRPSAWRDAVRLRFGRKR